MRWRLLLLLIVGLGWSVSAAAHSRSESFSTWYVGDDGVVTGSLSMLAREATRIPQPETADPDNVTRRYFAENFQVAGSEGVCPLVSADGLPTLLPVSGGYVRLEFAFDCKDAPAAEGDDAIPVLTMTNNSLFDLITAHIHYARIKGGGGALDEQVITFDRRTIVLQQPPTAPVAPRSAAETIGDFLKIGFDHILGGLDHLAFLAGVMILAGRWRIMALAITGFTLGHAITIALAVLEIVTPNSKMIEAGIGYTIALVAVEYIGERTGLSKWLGFGLTGLLAAMAGLSFISAHPRLPDPYVLAGLGLFTLCYMQLVSHFVERAGNGLTILRVSVTAMFGLIHGFGFGGSLLELGIGREQVVTMLIGFNLGVELGQLALVVGGLALFFVVARLVPKLREPLLAELCMSGLAGLGLYWFIARSFML